MKKDFWILSLGFLFIFLGFDTGQQYLSAVFYNQNSTTLSFLSIGLIYASFALGTIVAPQVTRRLGLKNTLVISSLSYPIYLCSVASASLAVLVVSSIIVGIGASFFWTSQGTYLIRLTTKFNRGSYSGLFFAAMTLGTAAVIFIARRFISSISYPTFYLILAAVSLCGTGMLLLLSNQVIQPRAQRWRPVMNRKLFFLPFIFAAGLVPGFMITFIPVLITSRFGIGAVGIIGAVFLVATLVGTMIIGKLGDMIGLPTFIYAAPVSAAGIFLVMRATSVLTVSIGVILIATLHATMLSSGYNAIAALAPKQTESAIALRWMVMCLAIISATVISAVAQAYAVAFFCIALLVAFCGIIRLHNDLAATR